MKCKITFEWWITNHIQWICIAQWSHSFNHSSYSTVAPIRKGTSLFHWQFQTCISVVPSESTIPFENTILIGSPWRPVLWVEFATLVWWVQPDASVVDDVDVSRGSGMHENCYISFSLSSFYQLSRRSDSAPDATSFLTDYSSTCYTFRIYTYFRFQVFF